MKVTWINSTQNAAELDVGGVEYYGTQSDDPEDIYNAPDFENTIVKGQIVRSDIFTLPQGN